MAKALPPLWFVGLHETLAGSVIDTLPRAHPSWFPPKLVIAERDATDLYRSLWPRYHELASIGIAALVNFSSTNGLRNLTHMPCVIES
jgi:hypothetical protein